MKEVEKKSIRILHIVSGMDTGGVETWLMHVLRRIDRARFQFDFLTHTNKHCFYDDEIRSLGCRIICCMSSSRLWSYARNFRSILKEHGPYDVVHSHVHHFSGFTLMLARYFGVPKRIAHSHSDTSLNDGRAGFWRKFYLRSTKWLIRRNATIGLACSSQAATNLFGKDWNNNSRWRVLYCGIDLDPFESLVDRVEVRQELGIPSDAFVLGHVGRFTEEKNHDFLLDIFEEVIRREPNAYLLLVGDGPLRKAIEQKAQRLNLIGKIRFAGVRPDVPRLMLGAMDVFVFPSHHEGLPLVLVESQAAGLPAVISEAVPVEAIVIPGLIKTLSLKDGVAIWAQAVANSMNFRQHSSESQQLVSNSRFNVIHSATELCNVYSSGIIYKG